MGHDDDEPVQHELDHDSQRDDGLEIEVSSLRPVVMTRLSGAKSAARPLFTPSRSRRMLLGRGIGVASAVLVVVVALVLSLAPTREALRGVVFGPTPTATAPIPAGEDTIYIALSPRWGSLALDKHLLPVAQLPIEARDQPLRVSRGRHVLHWQFAPIIDYSCVFSVPSAQSDSCATRVGIQPGKKGVARVLTLQLSLAMLPPGPRASLLAAMEQALDASQSSDIVRPGERYVNLTRSMVPIVATGPLRATLRFVLDAENPTAQCGALQAGIGEDCLMNGDCRELCTAPWQHQAATTNGTWRAYIVAHASWRFATPDGQVVADNQPDTGNYLQFLGNDEHPIPVTIGWDDGQWQVSIPLDVSDFGSLFSPAACLSAQDEVAFQEILPVEIPDAMGAIWLYVPGQPVASGCLAAVVPTDAQGLPDTSAQALAQAGLILHRFGVDLAANAAAHRYWPDMPIADAYEQAIAQQVAEKLQAVVAAGHYGYSNNG